jgi:hypothetical protein
MRNTFYSLMERSEWKRPLGRPRFRTDDNILMGVKESM